MELFLLLVFFCAFYMALEIFFSKVWNKGLHVDIHIEDSIVREGGQTRLIESITNQKKIALPILHVKNTFAVNKKVEEYLYVTPKKMLPMELPLKVQGLIGDTVSEKAMFKGPFEFKGIRQYQPYDNYRSINWKAFARQQKLQVTTHFSTYTCKLFFVLN